MPSIRQRGQASVEAVAAFALAAVAAIALVQLLLCAWALLTAGEAARAAARAQHVGSDPEEAADRAVPVLLGTPSLEVSGERVSVRLDPPGLLPGSLGITASAALDPTGGRR